MPYNLFIPATPYIKPNDSQGVAIAFFYKYMWPHYRPPIRSLTFIYVYIGFTSGYHRFPTRGSLKILPKPENGNREEDLVFRSMKDKEKKAKAKAEAKVGGWRRCFGFV